MAAQDSAANPIHKSGEVALASRWRVACARFFVSCSIALTSAKMSTKRASYNLKFKRVAIVFAEDNGNHSAAAEFGVDRACIIRWRKQRDRILIGAATRKKFTRPRKGRQPELEEEVCEFVRSERNRGFAVTADALQTKAMEIARSVADADRRANGACLPVPAGTRLCPCGAVMVHDSPVQSKLHRRRMGHTLPPSRDASEERPSEAARAMLARAAREADFAQPPGPVKLFCIAFCLRDPQQVR
ncbi:hypothetical protein HPB52_014253 [Rhipicephalus sanguineus]|uniref:HTH CENPB-type domain-containing protein n=1 Tax=Rhipicephalus sanguineus TaxID=34632 RepID=A0A9D4QDU5_RHISA|nr:hypothetical protein HPB52_014253 [Rhipicephalus sanguineus]